VRFGGGGRRVSLIARFFWCKEIWVYGAMDGKSYRELIERGLIRYEVIGILWFCTKE
jgi:hypothetical protein